VAFRLPPVCALERRVSIVFPPVRLPCPKDSPVRSTLLGPCFRSDPFSMREVRRSALVLDPHVRLTSFGPVSFCLLLENFSGFSDPTRSRPSTTTAYRLKFLPSLVPFFFFASMMAYPSPDVSPLFFLFSFSSLREGTARRREDVAWVLFLCMFFWLFTPRRMARPIARVRLLSRIPPFGKFQAPSGACHRGAPPSTMFHRFGRSLIGRREHSPCPSSFFGDRLPVLSDKVVIR